MDIEQPKRSTQSPKEIRHVLHHLIEILQDGHQGMLEYGPRLKDEATKQFFFAESQLRANYTAELENYLHRTGEHDVKEGPTTVGAIHRKWGSLKSQLGGGDHELVDAAREGEEVLHQKYAEALEEKLPHDLRDMLSTQEAHIAQSLQKIHTFLIKKSA